jgi:hypothetical protein
MTGTRLLLLVGVMCIVEVSCAKNNESEPAGAGGDPTTSSSGTGGSTSSSSSGGGDDSCSEDPCKLVVPQCGCAATDTCTLFGDDGTRGCSPAGTLAQGVECTGTECGVGLLCLETAAPISTCVKFCSTDADCEAPGGLCFYKLENGAGAPVPGGTFCTENCDPAVNTGCALGTECQISQEPDGALRHFSRCAIEGLGVSGDPCLTNADCGPTLGCIGQVGDQTICLKWCHVAEVDSCPVGLTCSAFSPSIKLGNVEYGACL